MEKNISFEAALKRLEEIVKALETGDLDLEASIGMYKEGLDLSKHCNDLLSKAEQKIKTVVKSPDGSTVEQDMEPVEQE